MEEYKEIIQWSIKDKYITENGEIDTKGDFSYQYRRDAIVLFGHNTSSHHVAIMHNNITLFIKDKCISFGSPSRVEVSNFTDRRSSNCIFFLKPKLQRQLLKCIF